MTGYCYKTGIIASSSLNISFRVRDLVGNLSTGAAQNYLYDATPPSTPATQIPLSGTYFNTGTITFLRTTGIDLGIGQSGYMYQISSNGTFTSIVKSGSVITS